MKYDDASWHYGGDFPSHLPNEAGATHIGMFVAWCLLNNLGSEFHLEEFSDELNDLKNRKLTPGAWFINTCDEKFTDDDLSDEGNSFADFYYQNEKTKQYDNDYTDLLCQDLDFVYEVPDSWETYEKLAPKILTQFKSWKKKNS